jgi:hypothetical protein
LLQLDQSLYQASLTGYCKIPRESIIAGGEHPWGKNCFGRLGWQINDANSNTDAWTSEKGKTLLEDKITIETGLVLDNDSYRVVEPGPEEETDAIILGEFDNELEAALAHAQLSCFMETRQKLTSLLRKASTSFFRVMFCDRSMP